MKFEWECINIEYFNDMEYLNDKDKHQNTKTYRAKIKGGWLIRNDNSVSFTMVFLPDEYHSWKIEE